MDEEKKRQQKFLIDITDCQHATWQGQLTIIEKRTGDRTVAFRSALELIEFMKGSID